MSEFHIYVLAPLIGAFIGYFAYNFMLKDLDVEMKDYEKKKKKILEH